MKIMVPMRQLSQGVFWMCISSCSIQRVEATLWAKQQNTCTPHSLIGAHHGLLLGVALCCRAVACGMQHVDSRMSGCTCKATHVNTVGSRSGSHAMRLFIAGLGMGAGSDNLLQQLGFKPTLLNPKLTSGPNLQSRRMPAKAPHLSTQAQLWAALLSHTP